MKVLLEFQPYESLPPDLFLQLTRALGQLLANYGLSANVVTDRASELRAYQEFWAWNTERMAALKAADDFPVSPADAEVK